MALSLQQVQKQTQRLIMTPQMQQSIQLLQMSSMELEALVREEMLENPFLEMADEESDLRTEEVAESPDTQPPGEEVEVAGLSEESRQRELELASAAAEDDFPAADLRNAPAPSEPGEGAEEPYDSTASADGFENFSENDVDWSEEFADSDTVSYGSVKEDSEEHDFTTFTGARETLYDSLRRQLRLSRLDGLDVEIGEFIIGNLDDNGYLDSSLPNQCQMAGYPAELVTPETAGPAEQVDEKLRRMLAKLRGGEHPDAFTGMKRKEIIHRIIAEILGLTFDEVAVMRREEQYVRLIAHQLKRPYEELAELSPPDLLLEVIAWRVGTDAQRVFDVLEVIQEFEPTGIAARDLAECLRLQCEEQGIRNRLLYDILENHLSDLQQKRFREISREMGVPEDRITEVFNIISRLDPKPGASTGNDSPQYITPDVYVKKIDGKYLYSLNEGDVGRLKVAANYRRLMNKAGRKAEAAARAAALEGTEAPAAVSEHAEYASEKYKSAVWLIRNIEKRKSTILRVTEAIMDYQKEFLEKGIEHLRPLTLRDIAERVGMHESTIARVTTKKYVETPRGIFELKYFFSSGLETDEGEAASSRSIKELLTQMIEGEDKRRPLSDQKIADMLRKKGFMIARRTVAKYREQLKILPAKLRKEVKGSHG